MIDIEQLELQVQGRRLLAIPRLQIREGERVAIVGPNGAGKSTLLRLLGGNAPAPWQGRVHVLGRALPLLGEALRQHRAELAQIPQGLHLVGRLSARDNLLCGALARTQGWAAWRACCLGRFPAELEAEADAWLHRLGLAALAHTRADRLSGGERQRVAIGRAAMQAPRLLLADEASAALDPRAAQQACDWLREAAAGGGQITVLHQLELLPSLAERVIGLRAGQIVLDRAVNDSPALHAALSELFRPAGPGPDMTHQATASAPGLAPVHGAP
ncbi:phosphonate ABC transporter ATP-binding protein [Inhella sp.]|uniref:phosphonate ABC transporter ATP-binding protein n=1 Tax=Inhella sp. TaxID=1921806 RepID=UPI0035B2B302